MLMYNQESVSSGGRWQTVAEFSLLSEADCEYMAADRVAGILAGILIPDHVLMEVKQAVSRAIEKELSRVLADQPQRTFTISVRTQSAQSLEIPVNEADRGDLHTRTKGWGFFLTEIISTETEWGNEKNHTVISVHLYHEGHTA